MGIMLSLPEAVFTRSLNDLGENSMQYTLPLWQMSDTCDEVVPLAAPRYRTLLSSLNGNVFPPHMRYAESLLLVGFHSLYSVPPELTRRSPYTLIPGLRDTVYRFLLSVNTVPFAVSNGSMLPASHFVLFYVCS